MNCPNCGHENKSNAKFCVKCRHKLKKYNFDPYIIGILILIILLLIFILISSHRGRSISHLEIKSQEYLSKNNDLITDYNSCLIEFNNLEVITQKCIDLATDLNNSTENYKLLLDNKFSEISNLNQEINNLKEESNIYKKLDVNFNEKYGVRDAVLFFDTSGSKNIISYISQIDGYSNNNNERYLIVKNNSLIDIQLNEPLLIYSIYFKFYFSDLDQDSNGLLLRFGNKENYINMIKDQNKFYFTQLYGSSNQQFDINYNHTYNLYIAFDISQPVLLIKDLNTTTEKGLLLDQIYPQYTREEVKNLYYLDSINISELDENQTSDQRLFEINTIKVYSDYNESYSYSNIK